MPLPADPFRLRIAVVERQTRQRKAILTVLREQGRPLTVEEILRFGRRHVPRLGMTTVYRSIREMLGEGVLLGVQYPGQPTRYELPAQSDHIHFICNHCRKVHDLPLSQTEISLSLPRGFVAEGQELIVYGTCADCRQERQCAR